MNVMGLILVGVLAIVLGRWAYGRLPKRRERQELKALLGYCHGDQDLAERLIFAEMQRDDSLDFAQAARRARTRLMRDRN